MCGQCVATAATAATAATGLRAWLATRSHRWLTPRRLQAVSVTIFASAVLAASVRL